MTPTEQDKELREKIADVFDELCEPTNEFWHRDSGLHWAGKVMQLIAADRKRVAVEAAVMGAKFGNAAIRQHNIADPAKPMNLDVVRDSGIQQAKAWAERQC